MVEREDLYTDYALQIFSSYLNEDIQSMHIILDSFKSEGKNVDEFFMPGLVYGFMYHMATLIRLVSIGTGVEVEKLLSDYAMDYAVAREELLDNPLLNVQKAKEIMDQIIETLKDIEILTEDDDD